MTAYCLKYGEPKGTQTIWGQTKEDVAGSNHDYVYKEWSEEESDEANMTTSNESSPVIKIAANIESNRVVFHESSFVAVSYGGHLGLLELTKDWKYEYSTVHWLIYKRLEIWILHCPLIILMWKSDNSFDFFQEWSHIFVIWSSCKRKGNPILKTNGK